jgi:hypothetical protein
VSDDSPSGHGALPRALARPTRETLALAAVVLLGLLVRLPGLGASFYGDEVFSVLRDSEALITPTEDRFRPVFFSLLFVWKRLGFHGETGLRALPLLFGILQIPVAFEVGKLLSNARAGLVFAALVALNPLLIEFSQELRMYSLLPLIALFGAKALIELCSRRARNDPVVGAWAAFTLSAVLGTYTHVSYWFLLAGFAVALVRNRARVPVGHSVLTLGAVVFFYLPNLPNLLHFAQVGAGGPHLTSGDLPSALPKLLAAFTVGFNYFALPQLGLERAVRASVLASNPVLTALATLPALMLGWHLVRLHSRRKPAEMLWLAHALFTIPIGLSWAAMVLTGMYFPHPKYMVASAPFALLLITATYLDIESRLERWLVAVLGLAVFAIAIVHFNQPAKYGRREDWRGAAAFLSSAMNDDSMLLRLGGRDRPFAEPSQERPRSLLDYYGPGLRRRSRHLAPPRPGAPAAAFVPALTRLSAGKRDVYYVWSETSRNRYDPSDLLLAAARTAFTEERKLPLNPRLAVYQWRVK